MVNLLCDLGPKPSPSKTKVWNLSSLRILPVPEVYDSKILKLSRHVSNPHTHPPKARGPKSLVMVSESLWMDKLQATRHGGDKVAPGASSKPLASSRTHSFSR